jgi:acetylornithine deacetylase/succinyl-diaminopimelate desuccinylase-like protein
VPESLADFSAYDAYIDAHLEEFTGELIAFCAQPALAGQRVGLAETSALVRRKLEALGARATVVEVPEGAPAVLAELGQGERTLLLYNHYDVQPADPLDLWHTPPFEPTVRDGKLYARGVADDRGDLLARFQAIAAYEATVGPLPLRLRWFIEGEEEIGSPHLAAVTGRHAAALQADWCAWEGAGWDETDTPGIVCGVKGLLYVELHATGPDHDVHSGAGGVVPNPAWRLVEALHSMRAPDGRFTLDGLDDLVAPPDPESLAAARALPFDDAAKRRQYGIARWQRDLSGPEVHLAQMFEPTGNIAGFLSGYTGPGPKTIVPGTAMVKMDFRLVPNQTPDNMADLLRRHLDTRGFTDVRIEVLGRLAPARVPVSHPLVGAAAAVWEQLGVPAHVQPMTGGSGPLAAISDELGIPAVMVAGPGYAGSRIHSPNEHIRLADYRTCLRYWGRFFHHLARF